MKANRAIMLATAVLLFVAPACEVAAKDLVPHTYGVCVAGSVTVPGGDWSTYKSYKGAKAQVTVLDASGKTIKSRSFSAKAHQGGVMVTGCVEGIKSEPGAPFLVKVKVKDLERTYQGTFPSTKYGNASVRIS